jgi:hypothetical protein
MGMMTNLLTAGAVAAVVSLGSGAVEATTVVVQDGVYDIGYGDLFVGVVLSAGGAGSWTVTFNAIVDPLLAGANASITSGMLSAFENLTMSWVATSDGFLLNSIGVETELVSLSTEFTTDGIFGGNDIGQYLIFSWTDSEAGAGFDFDVTAAAVPVPAAGFLLVGALGGLVALRRRKSV